MLTSKNRRLLISYFCFGVMVAAAPFGSANAQSQNGNVINIKNFMFSPMDLTIKAGSSITWKNLDDEPHTVVNDAGLFHSTALDQDATFTYRFDKPGVYKIFCGIHPFMKETITVQ
jgi:plastocyanin